MVRPDPERIRKRIAALPASGRIAARAEEVKDSVLSIVAGTRIRRGDLEIVFDAAPQLVLGKLGEVIGVGATVRVFRGANELAFDDGTNFRDFHNPPTMVPDGTTFIHSHPRLGDVVVRNFKEDPREAFLTILEKDIRNHAVLR